MGWTWPTILLVIICVNAQDIGYNPYNSRATTEYSPYFQNQNQNSNPNTPYFQNQNQNPNNPFPQSQNPNNPYSPNQNPNNPYSPNQNPNNQYSPNQNPNQNDPFSPNQNPNTNTNNGQDPFNPFGGQNQDRDRERDRDRDRFTPNTPFGQNEDRRFNPITPGGGRNYDRDSNSVIITEATYFVVASRMVRPGALYKVIVSILQARQPITVRTSISRNGVEMSADSKDVKEGIPESLLMRVPPTSVPGVYKLRVEGLFENILGGSAFVNETILTFSQRSMTIFIQLDKPVYMQGETVRFRTIPINTELKAFDNAVDVYMLDPNRHIMRRWLSRQSNLGTVSLEYQLSDQPVFGDWTIQVIAQGQVEESNFTVEEYYQTRFEVNVTMPPFFFTTDRFIHGVIHANYTSGAPAIGNLTLKATLTPMRNQQFQGYVGQQDRDRSAVYTGSGTGYRPQVIEKYFNFDEDLPFWFNIPEYNYYTTPHLKFFEGVYEFRYPMDEIERLVPNLDGMEVQITATVGEQFLDEIIEGFAIARIYNSSIKVSFAGGSPQVFKPQMPFTCYIIASYHDSSRLSEESLMLSRMEVHASVEMKSGGRRDLSTRELKMSADHSGIWEYQIDLSSELGRGSRGGIDNLKDIASMRVQANLKSAYGERATSELLILSHYSPNNHQIKVYTSTAQPKVGEYFVIHIQTNFFIEKFNYLVISKGIVLITGEEMTDTNIHTMAISLSAEMAPVATVVVWHVGHYGDVVADSLTFPVNGISRNEFSVFINNKKARTGHQVEVAIYGEPGSYVGLSGIDTPFYTMQADNELTYAKVLTKMSSFDDANNGTLSHTWFSHAGNADELVYFPSSTFGIDANRTFEYAGLVIFSDIAVPRRNNYCNLTLGLAECLNGRCYRVDKKCDGYADCEDGTDESGCPQRNMTDLRNFRKNRFNRIQRHYENVWLWRDVNIGPHGRYIFNIPVPPRPAHWIVSAFSMSPSKGFGMLQRPLIYEGVLPFFINVEMPTHCRQGEQIGIRVTVFNYMMNNIEATVVLNGSPDYKFVHVEENGIVRSYNPRTSFGEHQFFIYIKAQDATIVHMPVVPTRLGDIKVTLHASTLIGKDQVTRMLHVEADGLPQHRHQSVLLDLSNRAYVFQYMHVNVTETPIISYDADRYYVYGSNRARVSVVGDVVGPIFPTMPVNATSLLHLPMDSGEQNMFSFAANLYTTMYMRLINQRNRTLERQSFYYMNIGYQRQMSFMNPDGSFSLFRSDWNQSSPSVWLTSYCARVFQEASFYEWENYIYIDPQVISKAVEWVLAHQTNEGSFYEVTWLPDRKFNRSLNYDNDEIQHRNISLTAHVLITLETVKDLAGGLGAKVALAQDKAIKWLDRNMNLLEEKGEAFEVAIVAYALMLSKAPIAERAFTLLVRHSRSEGGLMYWGRKSVPQPPFKVENQKPFLLPRLPYDYDAENIESTSYALLTYVARQELFIERIVMWLNAQRLTDGGWASTQDTGMAMKALIEYTVRSRLRDVSSLTVSVEATSLPGQTKILHVDDVNLAQLQSIDIPEAWGTVKVQAKGAGYAILQMSVQYNVDIQKFQTDPPIKAFDLYTRAEFHGRNQSHISYISCQKWTNLNESIRSGLTVLDIAIPTGYIIQQQKLDYYVRSKQVNNLQRARFQEGKVLFYFDFLDHDETCINLTIERWHPVANMSRYLPVRIYDYYAPERFNETLFDSLPTYLLNICEVCGSSQCPYCAIYNIAATLTISTTMLFFSTAIYFIKQVL